MGDETDTNECSQNNYSANDAGSAGNTGAENKDPKDETEQRGTQGASTNTANFHGPQAFSFQGAHVFHGAKFYFGQQELKDKSSESESTGQNHARDGQEKRQDESDGEKESQKQNRTITDTWFDRTVEFDEPRGIRPHLDQAELLNQLKDFENNKLIFITCADGQMAKSGAYSLIERLNLPETQKRLLDFLRIGKETSICEITQLLQGNPGTTDMAVVIDLFNPKAEQFFYSLIETVAHSPDPLCQDLKRARIYLLCVVYAAELSAKLNLLNAPTVFAHDHFFPYWKISFLEPLLQHHYPKNYKELVTKIMERRSWWDPDERVFCHQLKMLIQEDKLIETLQKPFNVETPPHPRTLFKNQDALIDTVMYAGTFFTDLKPREFDRVVNLLLGSRTKTITVSTVSKNANGTSEQVQVEQQKPLVELWRESMDRIKAECLLTASPSPEGASVVNFRNHQFHEDLRDYLCSSYPSFLNTQLEHLMDAGLLFDSSANVAIKLANLVAEVAVTDSEYLEEWFERLLDEVEGFFVEPDSIRAVGPILQPLAGLNDREAQTRLCKRIALLIKRMLEAFQLKDTANGLLEQIMRRQLFLHVLEIVKTLRFTADFDEFHWFKQLIERGDAECRRKTVLSLSYRMHSIGPRVYQMLREMDSWVKVDPPSGSYSRSGGEAVGLLIEFCSDTTVYRPLEQYGLWPSSHPLFRFADTQSASASLKLLSRWLFHPRMRSVITERFTSYVNYSIGALVAEWIFILLKPAENFAISSDTEQVNAGITPFEVAHILIQQLAEASDQDQHEELLYFWEFYSANLLSEIEEMLYADAEGSVKIWKRNLLNDLITQFKAAAYEQEVVMTANQAKY